MKCSMLAAAMITASAMLAFAIAPPLATKAQEKQESSSRVAADPTDFEERPQSLVGEEGDILAVDYSSDGSHIATGSGRFNTQGSLTLWDAAERRVLASWQYSSGVRSVEFSPDGKRLASTGWNKELVVREIPSGDELYSVPIGTSVARLAWSPDGTLIATAAFGVVKRPQQQQTLIMTGVKLWEAETGNELAELKGDIVRYHDVAFSPDGKLLATAGGKDLASERFSQINLWDVAGRRQIAAIKDEGAGILVGMSFSPDGSLLAAAGERAEVKLWNVERQTERTTIAGFSAGAGRPVFSPDGKILAVPGFEGLVKLWSLADERELASLRGHQGAVRVAAFSPDGKTLVSGGDDRGLHWWDVASRGASDVASANDSASLQSLLAIAHSPDGRLLATSGEDRVVRLIDTEQGRTVRRIEGFDDVVASLAFSPDGKQLATGSFDYTVRLWNVASGEESRRFEGHTNWVQAVAFSPDGELLASSGYDKMVFLWNLASGEQVARLQGHSAAVRSLAFSPDGKQLASGSADRTIIVWSVDDRTARTTIKGHEGGVRAVAFSPDGKSLTSAAEDKTVRLWNPDSGEELRRLEGHAEMVWCLAFTPGGRTLVSGSYDGAIKVWDPKSGAERSTLTGHDNAVSGLSFAPDGMQLVSSSYDKTLRVWTAKQPPLPPLATLALDHVPVAVAFSPDGKMIAHGGSDHHITLCDIHGSPLRVLKGHGLNVFRIVFSPDSKTLASGSFDNTVRLWDVRTGRQLAVLEGHQDEIRAVDFSSDGTRLASSSWDGTAIVWDVEHHTELLRLPKQSLPVNSVEFSPDDRLLLTASGSYKNPRIPGELKLWDAATGREIATFPEHDMEVKRAGFSLDGRWVVSVLGKRMRIWDAASRELHGVIPTSSASNAIAFMPQPNLLAAGGMDGSVIIWDVDTLQSVARYEDHDQLVFSVDVSPDGSILASASRDTNLKLFRVNVNK